MPYLTGLARVARLTGYPVMEVPGWETRGHGPMGEVKTIVAHHTAGPKTGNYPSIGTVRSGRPGLEGPLSQLGIGRDGTIYVIAAGLCYHAGPVLDPDFSNDNALGIEAENTGLGEEWSRAQLDAYVKLCAALVREFGLEVTDVRGHKEICYPKGRKTDPYFAAPSLSMVQFRAHVKSGRYITPPKADPAPDVKPAGTVAKSYPAVALKPGPKATTAMLAAWSVLLRRIGYADRYVYVNMQEWLRDLEDPQTGKPYYAKRFRIDNIFGTESVKALQSKLHDTKSNGKRLYTGQIDGVHGPMTIGAEFAYLEIQRAYLNK